MSILEHVQNQLSTAEIADREGLDITNVGKKIAEAVAQLGIVRKPLKYPVAYGQTDASLWFRMGMGTKLQLLLNNHTDVEVSRMTGVPRNQQKQASGKPWTYDWKMSQLERLATASGMTLDQLIQYGYYRPKPNYGFLV